MTSQDCKGDGATAAAKGRVKEAVSSWPVAGWQVALDAVDEAVCLVDASGRVLHGNRPLSSLLGRPPQELNGRPFLPLLQQALDGQAPWPADVTRLGHRQTAEIRVHDRWFRLTLQPLRQADGRVAGAVHAISEVTYSKRIKRALQKSERMATVGKLAGTLAHEINNPVASVANALFLLERSPLDATSREYVDIARQELDRLARVVRKTLGFYRETRRPEPVEPAQVLDDVMDLHARKIQADNITVHRRYDFAGAVIAHPADLRHMLSNLVQNALEASRPGGSILLRVRRSRDWADPQRAGVRVVVADNGPGMPAEHRGRALEPLFPGEGESGPGLSLWIADCILRKHGGWLRLRNGAAGSDLGLTVSAFLPDPPSGSRKTVRRNVGRRTAGGAAV